MSAVALSRWIGAQIALEYDERITRSAGIVAVDIRDPFFEATIEATPRGHLTEIEVAEKCAEPVARCESSVSVDVPVGLGRDERDDCRPIRETFEVIDVEPDEFVNKVRAKGLQAQALPLGASLEY